MFSAKPRDAVILTDRERSLSSIKVGVVFVGRWGVRVSAMYVVFYRLSLLFGWWFVFVLSRCFFVLSMPIESTKDLCVWSLS